MAQRTGNQAYLGIDSSALLPYLIPEHPQHDRVAVLARREHAVNATVIHETYHTAVFKLMRRPADVTSTLLGYLRVALCLSLTSQTAALGLRLAAEHGLGGRDALILASYLSSREVDALVTLDRGLLRVGRVVLGERTLEIRSP